MKKREETAFRIVIPKNAAKILEKLKKKGHKAYCVGGSVRDSIMGAVPGDWDIATSATPEETAELLSDYKVIPTGIKHGTVTAVIDGESFEITTFRLDGGYSDGRHPDSVSFTSDIVADLARRDFTVNAIAYSEKEGITDPFGGINDIEGKLLRTVGEPEKRFSEDGLRIMRALRFAAVLGFKIEDETQKAIHEYKHLLKEISAERLQAELTKLVMGDYAFSVLMEYPDVLSVFIPEIAPAVGFSQYGKKHAYDVWEHICHTVDTIPPLKILRLTMLLHDLGKVPTHTLGENGSQFKNHAAVGGEMAKEILTRLKFDRKTIDRVSFLVTHHDYTPPQTKTELKRTLKIMKPDDIRDLLTIKISDRGALSPEYRDISREVERTLMWLDEIEKNAECCTLKQLKISGADLAKHKNLTGEEIGKTLDILLDAVIDGKVANEKPALLTYSI